MVSLTTRPWIRQLLDHGELAAAAALATAVPERYWKKVEPWRHWLRIAVARLSGYRREMPADPRSRTLAWLRAMPLEEPVFLAAMRVESALRRKEWTIALRETFTFRDLVRVPLLNVRHSRKRGQPWIVPSFKRIDLNKSNLTPERRSELDGPGGLKRKIENGPPDPRAFQENLARLEIVLDDPAGGALRGLTRGLGEDLRALRNDATHGVLSERDEQRARDLCGAAGVWAQPWGFLNNPAVTTLLREFDPHCPADCWDRLIEAVVCDMDDYSLMDSGPRRPDGE